MRFGVAIAAVALTACSAIIGTRDLSFEESAGGTVDGGGLSEAGPAETGSPDGATQTCNADLKMDLANCGACGHDCTKGKCVDGLCVLAEQLPGISHLALHGDIVYVALQGGDGQAARCATIGCATDLKLLVPADAGEIQPNRIAANDQFVFISEYLSANKGGVYRVGASGGGFVRLPGTPATLERSYGAAISATTLYWTTAASPGALYQCTLPDCANATVLTTLSNGELVAVSASGVVVYAENDGGLIKRCAPGTTCTPAPLVVTDFDGVVNDIVIDNETVYWATNLGEVLSCPTSGCATAHKVTPEAQKVSTAAALAVSGNALYWSTMAFLPDGNNVDEEQGVIHACTLPNCTDGRVLATGQHDPASMGLDAKSVYWGNSGHRNYVDGRGDLVKAPR